MNRVILLALLVYLLLLAGIGTLNGPMVGLAVPLVLYLLAGLWGRPDPPVLQAERQLSVERVVPGDLVTITLTVTNLGGDIEETILWDPLPFFLEVIQGNNSRVVSLRAGQSLTWSYTVRGQRGYHLFEKLDVLATDRLGLMQKRAALPTSGQLLILPVAPRVRHIAIRPRQTRVYSGTIPARQGGPGIEFFGVRAYQTGDTPRWINWRVSARHTENLYTNEFEQERIADVGIILDGRRRVNQFGGGNTIFEHSVLATVAMASALLADGNRVGLMVYGKSIQWTIPGYGKKQRERIMQALAMASIGENQLFAKLVIPRRLFPTHSQIILVSPLHDEDLSILINLRLSGYQLLVVSPDPISFEARCLPDTPSVRLAARVARLDREVALRRLRRAGIQVVDWDVAQPFDWVVKSALSRPAGFLRALESRGGR